MNIQRILAMVKQDLKKMIREPAFLFLIILFPVVLTLAFGVSFGAVGGDAETTYDVGIVDLNPEGTYNNWTQTFLDSLKNTTIIKLRHFSANSSAQDALGKGDIQAVIVIPVDFGESCNAFRNAPTNQSQWINTTVALYLDKGSMIASQAIPPIIQQSLTKTLLGEQALASPTPITLGLPAMVDAEKKTVFDFMVPGLFAYGAIFLTMTVAQSLTTQREEGILRRLSTTPLTSSEFMTAQATSNMVVAVFQVVVIFGMAFLLGYRPETGPAGILMAFVIVTVLSLCCVGFGLITAAIAKSSGTATGLAFIFILPQMFLGTFVSGLTPSSFTEIAGKAVPSYYTTDALTHLFLRGAPVTSEIVVFDLVMLLIISAVIFCVGLLVFKRFGRA